MPRAARRRSCCSRPAAPADICFRRRRWRALLQKRGVTVDLATDYARRAFQISRPRRAPHPERDLARPQSVRARAHRDAADARHRQGLGAARAHQARRGGRLRRLSDRAAACGRPRCAASRPCCTSRTASWAAPTALLAPRVTAIATGFRTLTHARSALAGKDHLHRQSGARRSDRRGGDALCRAGARRKIAPAGVRRQPGRARDGGDRAGGDRAACRRHCARGCRSCSRRAPRTSTRCAATYARLGVAAECAPFFSDLPARMAAAHLVISRSGASTVAELSAIGRPAILVPLPHALDQDQFVNAGVLEAAGGAIRIEQRDFTPERLAAEIAALGRRPRTPCPHGAGRQIGRHPRCRRAAGRSGIESRGNLSISSWPALCRPSTPSLKQ